MNTTETATARSAIFAWVLPLAVIREWFMGRSRDFDVTVYSEGLFRGDVAIVSCVLRR
jgi:hypothetical protein